LEDQLANAIEPLPCPSCASHNAGEKGVEYSVILGMKGEKFLLEAVELGMELMSHGKINLSKLKQRQTQIFNIIYMICF
jgi:hypothetical protein